MKIFLLSLLLILTPLSAADRPNVLFISVDDWNDWIGDHGGNQAKTPNLDQLSRRGVAFRYAHTSAVYCAPSRTSLMTGQNPHSTGAYYDEPHFAQQNRPGIKDLPWWFRDHGYHVTGGGKLYHHMPGFIDMRGWDNYFHWNEGFKQTGWGLKSWESPAPLPSELPYSPMAKLLYERERKRHPDKKVKKLNSHMEWGILPDADEEKMADTICANWAADFLRNGKAPKGKPFFLGFGLYAPHKPNFVPQKYFKMNPLKDVESPGMHPDDLADLPPTLRAKVLNRKRRIHDPLHKLKGAKKAVRGYLASLSYADAMVGRVLDALTAGPYADNTIVMLWSDNGYHLGEKGCWAKHTLWERTSNVPFIWAGPGIAKGVQVDTTVSLLDTYPTLLELCALPANPENEGTSLASILKDPGSAKDRTVLQTDYKSFALINQQWRYTRYHNGEEELYHVAKDPGEHDNLAGRSEHRKRMDVFARQLPNAISEKGQSPRDLRLVFKGETFEWAERKTPKKSSKRKSAQN